MDDKTTPIKSIFEGSNSLPFLHVTFALILAITMELIKIINDIIKNIAQAIIFPPKSSYKTSNKYHSNDFIQ